MFKLLVCLLLTACFADEARYSNCFEQYMESNTNSSNAYAENYKSCFNQSNKSGPQDSSTNKRGKITEKATTLCERIRNCDAFENDLKFFQCNGGNDVQNLNDLIWINFSSKSAMIDLQNQYDEVEKNVLQCTVDAQQKLLVDMKSAYHDLLICLHS